MVTAPVMLPGTAMIERAEKLTVPSVSPETVALTVCRLLPGPSVHPMLARPWILVVEVESESRPPPELTSHLTGTPAMGFPLGLSAKTSSGRERAVLAPFTWLSPLAIASRPSVNTAVAEKVAPTVFPSRDARMDWPPSVYPSSH